MNEVRFSSGVLLPPCVGEVELCSGKKYDIRKKEGLNQANMWMTTYELWEPYASHKNVYELLPPSENNPCEQSGYIQITEGSHISEYEPRSYRGKTYSWVNSIKSFDKGAGSAMMKIAVLHSKNQGHEGRVMLKAVNDSQPFYEKLGFATLTPPPLYPEMYLQIEKIDAVANKYIRALDCYPDFFKKNSAETASCWSIMMEWLVALFLRLFCCCTPAHQK